MLLISILVGIILIINNNDLSIDRSQENNNVLRHDNKDIEKMDEYKKHNIDTKKSINNITNKIMKIKNLQ